MSIRRAGSLLEIRCCIVCFRGYLTVGPFLHLSDLLISGFRNFYIEEEVEEEEEAREGMICVSKIGSVHVTVFLPRGKS